MTRVECSEQLPFQHLGPQVILDNSGNGSLDNLSDGGEEEELGEPDGSATMTLSYLTEPITSRL